MDVHEPYVPQRRYVDLVDPSIRLNEDDMFALFKTVVLKRDVSNRETVELLRKLYMAGIRKVDDATREFFGTLERTGVLGKSYVIITADHGVDLVVCVAAAQRRGITEGILGDNFRISGLGQLVEMGIQFDRLVTFGD